MSTNTNARRGASRSGVLFAILGIAIGALVAIVFQTPDGANAQAPYVEQGMHAHYSQYSETFRDAIEADAAPKVTFGNNDRAQFSRPLEVPPLYAFDAPLSAGNGRQIILVDSETKRISVYWIKERGVNSTIELVATRNFELDLKLESFNGEGLSPSQIREQIESAR